jgi:hypothetical protein
MKEDINTGSIPDMKILPAMGKPGRPRAIQPDFESVVIQLHRLGYGYRSIARILRTDHHLNLDFSTVKRTLLRLGILPHPGTPNKSSDD